MKGAAEVLRAAADVLKEHGWTQAEWQDDNGCLCAEGAIAVAGRMTRFTDVNDSLPGIALAEYLRVDRIAHWNDARGRTPNEVIAAFHAAADLYEATHSAASLGEGRDG